MSDETERVLSDDRRVEYLLHADRERRAEPARDTMRCTRCRQFVPISAHLCPAELDQLRAELAELTVNYEHLLQSRIDGGEQLFVEREHAEQEAEHVQALNKRLRAELDATKQHLGGLLRQSITHRADRDALKERKNARIRALRAEVERLKPDAANILEAELSAMPEDLAEVTRERDDLARKLEFVLKDRDDLAVMWRRWNEQAEADRDEALRRLERAYDELAGWRAREPDGQSTAQALREAEQRVAALLDENAQLRVDRDDARNALRRHLAGQLLPADAYPWLDESDADELPAVDDLPGDYPRCPQCGEPLLNEGRVCLTHGEQQP